MGGGHRSWELAQAVAPEEEETMTSSVATSMHASEVVRPDFKADLRSCASLQQFGILLAWWVLVDRSVVVPGTPEWMVLATLIQDVAEARLKLARAKASTFPMREGELYLLRQAMLKHVAPPIHDTQFVQVWFMDSWVLLTMAALNWLACGSSHIGPGRWSSPERQAVESIRNAVHRRCFSNPNFSTLTEEEWKKDMRSKQVNYAGEEIGICHELTWEQVLPSLPPEEHGGCINALDWVGPQTRRFLLNPQLLLKDPTTVSLPRLPGKIHMAKDDRVRIAQELVRRNVCEWVPLESVYTIGSQPILNGLFGVVKPSVTSTGLPVLRLIMNLTGSNSTQIQLTGGTRSLPTITSWMSVVVEDSETVELFQSDMSSAFYLFKLPRQWQRHLCFNIVVQGTQLGLDDHRQFALGCAVIPMGWLNSVGIMQEISENLLKQGNLQLNNQLMRGKPIPSWFSDIIDFAKREDRAWWHVYLDNFAAGERVIPTKPSESGRLCHEAAEECWNRAGVAMSAKKRVSRETRIVELGAEVDGDRRVLGLPTEKLLKLVVGTVWILSQKVVSRKTVQVMAGRWVFALQFRRPGMIFFNAVWKFAGGTGMATKKLLGDVRREFLMALCACMTLHTFLGAGIADAVVATDASQKGGAVGYARELSISGQDFVEATRKLERDTSNVQLPILIISLFNGIGGAFRCYDVAGILPMGRIAVERDAGANRVTSHKWPGTLIIDDIHKVTKELCQEWSRDFLQVLEIHLWAGWPCVDLSSVKFNRLNLAGPNSGLFWLIPPILEHLQEAFGPTVIIKSVLENVASMDQSAANEVSDHLQITPYLLDCVQAVPMRRPRYCWSTESLQDVFPDVDVQPQRYWLDVQAWADYPMTTDWIEPDHTWEGEKEGAVFPTAMKSIPRKHPPPKPAGLAKCTEACKRRWREDQFRFPPYQYSKQFLITTDSTWRLLSPEEKELLLGYGYEHTKNCWNASAIKANKQAYHDARLSYLGDSFSVVSFVIMAVACCKRWLPKIPYAHYVKRLGLAPGFRAHVRSIAPIGRGLFYGSLPLSPPQPQVSDLNRLLLRRTNHTGSDIRIISGEIMSSKAFPRESAAAQWWNWQEGFNIKWRTKSHINVLELESILLGIKQQIAHFHFSDMRIFQLSDSYVCISVVSKGRSSSVQLQRVMKKISAHLLAHGLILIIGHVDSLDNPTDSASRR